MGLETSKPLQTRRKTSECSDILKLNCVGNIKPEMTIPNNQIESKSQVFVPEIQKLLERDPYLKNHEKEIRRR